MNDEDILNFMDAWGIQCWPEYLPDGVTIRNWVAQSRKPFHQVSRKTLRAAVVDLYHLREKEVVAMLRRETTVQSEGDKNAAPTSNPEGAAEPPPLHYKD